MKVISGEQIKTPEMKKEGLEGTWYTFEEAIDKVTFKSIRTILKKAPSFIEIRV